jgi:beta-glucosidase
MAQKQILDWNNYIAAARATVAEGCVLLENNGVLPLKKDSTVSIFGRIQHHYYKSGTGSGGMVNVAEVVSIPDGLRNSGMVKINEELFEIYKHWVEVEKPYNEGMGWGSEPWSQEEMPLQEEIVRTAAGKSDVAIVIIGRTAGEDSDATDTPGSNRLTDIEEEMLSSVRKYFSKMVVLLNVGGIVDMSFVDKYKPDAVMYVWQGGMIGGDGTADVLVGKTSPSGKLTDTIAENVSDYLSDNNFGGDDVNVYEEDIFVGYRYFETFSKGSVRYPFGYGLSYSKFDITVKDVILKAKSSNVILTEINQDNINDIEIQVCAEVKNVGQMSGKEVVQVYVGAPQGRLGKPARVLVGFAKTEILLPGQSEKLIINISPEDFASYDDRAESSYAYCKLLEQGDYTIYAGSDVRAAKACKTFNLADTCIIEKLSRALNPVKEYNRYKAAKTAEGSLILDKEVMPYSAPDEEKRRQQWMPEEIPQNFNTSFKLTDVQSGNCTLEEFIAQLSDNDLTCIVRGEGMGSSQVTPGTAAAFGGISPRLKELGIPAMCCDDGPSGLRLDSGVKAFSLPNGTMAACTFNTKLVEKLYSFTSLEMVYNKVEALLGPGINIHRHPLNGRNFEYFSEDPFVTGKMAVAMLKGLHTYGVTGTIKHFCANNQEHRRSLTDSVVSERALREIYLRAFEIVVKSGYADSIMTTYGSVNGLWTAGNYDLNTTILRKQWGFKGIVMTDWWAAVSERDKKQSTKNYAQMVRAGNNIYMVCSDASKNADGDNLEEALKDGSLKRSELQQMAADICSFALGTQAMKRLTGEQTEVEIINRPAYADDVDLSNIEFIEMDKFYEMRLDDRDSVKGTNYIIPLDLKEMGVYKVSITGSSELSRVAQIPCTLFNTGIPVSTYSFTGSEAKDITIERDIEFFNRFSTLRLFVARDGVKLKKIKFEYLKKGSFIDGNR